MRIACLGGGPAGLYFAIAMKRRDPGHDILVVERNRPCDTFGWGVVLSNETLANLERSDPESADGALVLSRCLELIEATAGRTAKIDFQPPRMEDMPFTHADLTKARKLLGYEPRVEIEVGVQEYVDWFQRTKMP
jgi:2-polyprenyl-6-methoxyphenol hydroxylase-like FAD-dependent oxidoreductase